MGSFAAHVFDINLMRSGSHPGYDGIFQDGLLADKTVNIKTYDLESLLDIRPYPSDYCPVLTGPLGHARNLPWVINSVFLFDHEHLLADLGERGVKIGAATSVRKADWERARIFRPGPASPRRLSARQLAWLKLFTRHAAV